MTAQLFIFKDKLMGMIRYLTLLKVLIITTPSLSQVSLPGGLIAYYSFSGNANDSSGNDNHGIVHGATLTADRCGNSNSAYFFDGVDDYIELPPEEFKNNNFSYSLWVSPQYPLRKVGSFPLAIGDSIDARYNGFLLEIPPTPTTPVLDFHSASIGPNFPSSGRGGEMKVQEWYHLVGTRSDNEIRFYIDGEEWYPQYPARTEGLQPYYGTHTAARIGDHCKHFSTNWAQPFLGRIDNVAIYKRAISAEEVKALHQQGLMCTYTLPPIAMPTVKNADVCAGDIATLIATGGKKYRWYIAEEGGRPIFEGNPLIIPGLSETTAFYVSNVTSRGESNRIKVLANVHTVPSVSCDFPEKTFTGEVEIYHVTVTSGTAPFLFDFTFDGNDTTSGTKPQVQHEYHTTGSVTTTARVTDAHGCTSNCSGVTIIEEPLIPNVITPNGDNYNQAFTAYRKEGDEYQPYSGSRRFLIRICNRWGKEIFVSGDPRGWEASDAPGGVYFYTITIGTKSYKGLLHVIK